MSAEFVDTNVLIYAHDADTSPKNNIAATLLRRLDATRSGVLSTQVLIEFYDAATRKLKLDAVEAAGIIADFQNWTVHRPAILDLIAASDLRAQYSISWWDALIVQSAIAAECITLWTEDLQHGQTYGSVTVRNPFL